MNVISKPCYNKVYSYDLKFELDDDCLGLSETISSTLSQGSACGFFAEAFVAQRLSIHVSRAAANTRGYDLISNDNFPIEVKSLTKHGVKFCQSSNVGAGRKIDEEQFSQSVTTKDFVIADTRNLSKGKLSFVILDGKNIQKASLSMNQGLKLFEDSANPTTVKWAN